LLDTISNKFLRYDDPRVRKAFKLSNSNIKARQKYTGALNPAKKPSTVEYCFVYGTQQVTDEGVKVAGLNLNGAKPWDDAGQGDGTVPSWSITEAAAQFTPHVQTHPFVGDHLGVLTTDAFRQFLYSFFKLSGPAPLVAEAPGVVVSLNKRTFAPNETMHALIIPDNETHALIGSLTLSRVSATSNVSSSLGVQHEVNLRGGRVRQVRTTLTAPKAPGLYRLDFGGANASHRTSDDVAGWFVVSGVGRLAA
jgi:hypothetical protein